MPGTAGANGAPGAGARYRLQISKVTSVVFFTRRVTLNLTGTLSELEAAYRKVLRHNLLAGWWGFPFGVVWTPMVLVRNRKALAKLHELATGNDLPSQTSG